jgi:hypothetical protein
MVDVLVQGVKGLLEFPSSMNLGGNLRAKLTQFFLGGHPLYLISQAIHISSHRINEAIPKELFMHDELLIESLTNWGDRLLELSVEACEVWNKVIF